MGSEIKKDSVNYTIYPGVDILGGAHKVKIGKNAIVQRDCWLNITWDNPARQYMIQIGEGANLGRRTNISASNSVILENYVLTGPNVHITDHNHEYRKIGIPIVKQGITSMADEVVIGEGSWLGINSIVVGNIRIGKGCVVGANSIVLNDLPDYCVAVGNPAKIKKILDYESGKWVRVDSSDEIDEILEKRKKASPLISICIATYNRATELETCLGSIFNQIGDDVFFEIIVCDNASEDNTPDVVKQFTDIYKNLSYYRNDTNIGAERNFLKAARLAKGEYIFFHGDDDFFKDGTLYLIMNTVNENRHLGLFFIDALRGSGQSYFSSGINNYLKDAFNLSTVFIAS